jgi:hypothetical protein
MRRERERIERRDEDGSSARGAAALPEHALLQLQRTAGNRAVGAMLARDTTTAEPADAKKEAAPSGPHVIVPGVGTIPIESFSLSLVKRRPPPGRDTSEEGPSDDKGKKDEDLPGGDVSFMSLQGKHSPELFRWSMAGEAKDLVVVVPKGTTTTRVTLKGCLVTVYTTDPGHGSSPVESWMVNCTAMRFDQESKQ